MFVGLEEPLPFAPPWDIPFETRRTWLEVGHIRVAYIYELEDTSTFRYRVFNMVEGFRAHPEHGIAASWFTRKEFHSDQSFVDRCDVIVICRTRYDEGVARLVHRAHARGIRVLFDIDDFVIDLAYAHYIMNAIEVSTSVEVNWDYWFSYIGRLRATLDLCDGTIATTRTLAHRLHRTTGGLPSAVIPNYLNRRQTEVSNLMLERKKASGFRRDQWVTMGFLSGSPSHARDLHVASPAIAGLLERQRHLQVRIVGFGELNEHLMPYRDRIERLPLQDYLNLQRVTAECEFCIVPLAVNDFSSCKSELKFFETGIVQCPIVATPIQSYADTITDGRDGLLAASHEWHEKLETAYSISDAGGDEYRDMAQAAFDTSVTRYAWDHQVDLVARTIDSLRHGVSLLDPADDPLPRPATRI